MLDWDPDVPVQALDHDARRHRSLVQYSACPRRYTFLAKVKQVDIDRIESLPYDRHLRCVIPGCRRARASVHAAPGPAPLRWGAAYTCINRIFKLWSLKPLSNQGREM